MTLQHANARQALRTLNSVFLRRAQKLVLPVAEQQTIPSNLEHHSTAEPGVLAALLKNMERLGFTFSSELLETASTLDADTLSDLHDAVIPTLRRMLGDHVKYVPMYPNFPQQVMDASDAELYLRALLHYMTGALPETPAEKHPELKIRKKLKQIEQGSETEYLFMIRNLMRANASLSEQDKQDVADSLRSGLDPELSRLLPEEMPYKENAAFVASVLLEEGMADVERLSKSFNTATDVLRLAAGLSGLDTSLFWTKKTAQLTRPAANPYNLMQGMQTEIQPASGTPANAYRFRNFKRSERRLLLGLLEKTGASVEDMVLYREAWKRLGEILHPGEMRGRYPSAFEAFTLLRRQKSIPTFRREAEEGLILQDPQVIDLLARRPGELARRLDLLLRSQPAQTEKIMSAFDRIADRLAVPLLLQLLAHFKHRGESRQYRVFFPKGNIGKAVAIHDRLPRLDSAKTNRLVQRIEQELIVRFAEREPLGAVYIDPRLANIPVPFSNRSASSALRSLPRGSRIEVPEGDILRLFCWWTNMNEGSADMRRVDIDLSLVLLDENWSHVETLAFYNLKEEFGVHSGDITNAPKGASEFIDLNIPEVLWRTRARYAMVQVACFTGQPFSVLPECFAGFMVRHQARAGQAYDPRTVESRFDLTVDAQQAVPFAIDLWENQLIWIDSVVKNRGFRITAHDNMSGLELLGRAFADVRRTTLGELYTLHAKARGNLTNKEYEADTVFGMEEGTTPYRTDIIVGEYL